MSVILYDKMYVETCNFSFRFITNRYLMAMTSQDQDVEWGYCFDVHLNAFFPILMILHFFQLPFLNGEHVIIL